MTQIQPNRVFLVGAQHETTNEVVALLEGLPYDVLTARNSFELPAERALLNGSCVIVNTIDDGADSTNPFSNVACLVGEAAIVFLVGREDVRLAVDVVKQGASDVIVWPKDRASLARVLSDALKAQQERVPDDEPAFKRLVMDRLTTREREVLVLLVKGNSNKQIGVELRISERTVEVHRANIMRKLNVGSFAALIRLALESGTGK